MTNKNVRICSCGDCDAAIDRALKMCKQMFNDSECVVFQTAVCAAFGGFIMEGTEITATDLLVHTGMPYDVARNNAHMSVESIIEPTEDKIIERFGERRQELVEELVAAYIEAKRRGHEDFKARQADSPNIGKSKE